MIQISKVQVMLGRFFADVTAPHFIDLDAGDRAFG